MANKKPIQPRSYTGRDILLQALDPLRRAHLEGKLEGLLEAGRVAAANPDYSGRLLSKAIQEAYEATFAKVEIEAKAAGGSDKP